MNLDYDDSKLQFLKIKWQNNDNGLKGLSG